MILEEINGKLYVTDSIDLTDEPKRIILHWRVTWADGNLYQNEIPCPVYRTTIEGVYQVGNVRFNIEERNSLKEVLDVPKPKTKKETRWHNGAWQKLMAGGWQIA